jgi:hypothetical protein
VGGRRRGGYRKERILYPVATSEGCRGWRTRLIRLDQPAHDHLVWGRNRVEDIRPRHQRQGGATALPGIDLQPSEGVGVTRAAARWSRIRIAPCTGYSVDCARRPACAVRGTFSSRPITRIEILGGGGRNQGSGRISGALGAVRPVAASVNEARLHGHGGEGRGGLARGARGPDVIATPLPPCPCIQRFDQGTRGTVEALVTAMAMSGRFALDPAGLRIQSWWSSWGYC